MKECLGFCLGPAQNEGNDMVQWILTGNGQVVPRRAICHLKKDGLALSNKTVQLKLTEFDAAITNRLGESFTLPPMTVPDILYSLDNKSNPHGGDFETYLDDDETPAFLPQANILDASGKPILQK